MFIFINKASRQKINLCQIVDVEEESCAHEAHRHQNEKAERPMVGERDDNDVLEHAEQLAQRVLGAEHGVPLLFRNGLLHDLRNGQVSHPQS